MSGEVIVLIYEQSSVVKISENEKTRKIVAEWKRYSTFFLSLRYILLLFREPCGVRLAEKQGWTRQSDDSTAGKNGWGNCFSGRDRWLANYLSK
jgi:hypothetical protein